MLDEGPAPQRIVDSSSPRPSSSRHPDAPRLRPGDRPARPAARKAVAAPTFVQIRKPAAAGDTRRTVGVLLGGLVLVAALVWLAPRDPQPSSAPPGPPGNSPQMADAPPDMYPESGTPMPEPAVLALQEAPPPDDTAAADGPEPSPPTGAPDREPESVAAAEIGRASCRERVCHNV